VRALKGADFSPSVFTETLGGSDALDGGLWSSRSRGDPLKALLGATSEVIRSFEVSNRPEGGSDAQAGVPRNAATAPTPVKGQARRQIEGAGQTLEASQGHERMPSRFTAMRQLARRKPRRVRAARIRDVKSMAGALNQCGARHAGSRL